MRSDAEIIKLIHQFKSNNPDEVAYARQELAEIGKSAIFHLLGAVPEKDIPNEEILKSFAEMSKDNAIQAYTMIMNLNDIMPPEFVSEAENKLQGFGIEPTSVIDSPKEKRCKESIDVELDSTCNRIRFDLEHSTGKPACYWLSTHIVLYDGKKMLRRYNNTNVSREAIDAVMKTLKSQGFSELGKSNEREWHYVTYMREPTN